MNLCVVVFLFKMFMMVENTGLFNSCIIIYQIPEFLFSWIACSFGLFNWFGYFVCWVCVCYFVVCGFVLLVDVYAADCLWVYVGLVVCCLEILQLALCLVMLELINLLLVSLLFAFVLFLGLLACMFVTYVLLGMFGDYDLFCF